MGAVVRVVARREKRTGLEARSVHKGKRTGARAGLKGSMTAGVRAKK